MGEAAAQRGGGLPQGGRREFSRAAHTRPAGEAVAVLLVPLRRGPRRRRVSAGLRELQRGEKLTVRVRCSVPTMQTHPSRP